MLNVIQLYLMILLFLHCSFSEEIMLRAGTAISFEVNQEINSEQVEKGNLVELLVKNDVKVKGKVLVAAGSPGEGRVKEVSKMCGGCHTNCPKVTIVVENVQAVDGQKVSLRSIPHTETKDCSDWTPVIIKIGTTVSGRVLNNIRIQYKSIP